MRYLDFMKAGSVCLMVLAAAACAGSSEGNNAANETGAATNEAVNTVANEAANAVENDAEANTPAPAANAAASAGPATRYEASGSEPFWSLTIARGQLAYDPADGPHIRIATPPRQPIPNGYRYVAPEITVEVVHTRCQADNEQYYADTVRVHVGDVNGEGCGE
jgi:uncharacterized membrane protein